MRTRLLPKLTRRALGRGLLAGAAAAAAPAIAAQGVPPADPVLRDAALRGLALAGFRGDPVAAEAAEQAIAALAATDPEAALLARLYRALDVRPSAWHRLDMPPADPQALRLLHGAIAAARPVSFGYTDLSDQTSTREALPLALVHPPQGVKLLAWCTAAQGFRQFFVRAMQGLELRPGDFAARRNGLLHALVDKEGA